MSLTSFPPRNNWQTLCRVLPESPGKKSSLLRDVIDKQGTHLESARNGLATAPVKHTDSFQDGRNSEICNKTGAWPVGDKVAV